MNVLVRRMVFGTAMAAAALLVGADAAAAAEAPANVPQRAGIVPFAAPEETQPSAVPILLRTGGVVLLGAGAALASRSWVSTAQTG